MPIYAYRCERCGHSQDFIQKFSDAPLHLCPSCGEDAFRKQLTAPAFQLKGSGWYVTDFRDSGKARAGKPDAKTADSAGASGEPAAPAADKPAADKPAAPAESASSAPASTAPATSD